MDLERHGGNGGKVGHLRYCILLGYGIWEEHNCKGGMDHMPTC